MMITVSSLFTMKTAGVTIAGVLPDGKKIDYGVFSQCVLPKPPEKLVKYIHMLKKAYDDSKQAFFRYNLLTDELKRSIISNVVTGRRDVRDIKVPDSYKL